MISPNRQECTSGRGRELFGWFNTIVADFFTFVVGGVNQVLYEKNIFSEENLPCDHNIQIVFVMLSSYARQNLKSTTDYLISSQKNKYIKRNFIIRRVFALRRSMINVSWTVWKQTKHQRITYATESPPVRIRRVRRRKHGFGQVRQSPVLCAQKIVQTSTRNKQTNESCAYVRWMNFVIFICSAKRNNPIIFFLHPLIPFYRHSRLVFLFFSFFFCWTSFGRAVCAPVASAVHHSRQEERRKITQTTASNQWNQITIVVFFITIIVLFLLLLLLWLLRLALGAHRTHHVRTVRQYVQWPARKCV